MRKLIFFLFIIIPTIEIILFIQAGNLIGFWPTAGLIMLTAIIGSYLVRTQGAKVLQEIQLQTVKGQAPINSMIHGFCILIAGFFLITPGFFTDTLGFLLLVPAIQKKIGRSLIRFYTISGLMQQSNSFRGRGPDSQNGSGLQEPIDVDYDVVDDDKDKI